MEWQPINTIPIGECVLICCVESYTIADAGLYENLLGEMVWEDIEGICDPEDITHWQPLPEPPQEGR